MDRLQSMRVFAKVVELGSFARAAASLNLSAPAVTRLVADLEDHLQTRLLHRTTRRLSLTETGTEYLGRVHRILHQIDDAEAVASAHSDKATGTLRMYCHPAFQKQLAKLIAEFPLRYPDVVVDVTVSDETPDLVAEAFDVGIVVNDQKVGARMITRQLAKSSLILTASPGYIARHGVPNSLEEIREHVCLSFTYSQLFHGCADKAGVTSNFETPIRSRTISNSGDFLRECALAGMGLMYRPSFAVMDDLQNGRLVRVLSGECLGMLGVSVVYPSRLLVPAKVRALIRVLIEEFPAPEIDPWLQSSSAMPDAS
ncbi:LysR family transcriptional regulator [Oxalobacteraceae bacterium OM1]|nr:LysR family transcriptional regulator [Oxalobacteraceae bacterium OM1]